MDAINTYGLAWAGYIIGCMSISGFLTAFWAHMRGFAWWPWLFAGHCIGWIALIILPSPKAPGMGEIEAAKNRQSALVAGIIIMCISLPIYIIQVVYTLFMSQQIPENSGGGMYVG
ncbi:MAG: hypothetical protein ABI743_10645 [bacterium]